ncbi:MAG: HipA domain-containing protein [Pseudomonadales bacterium]
MTSNNECFVYITLPGETSFITAGRFVMDKARGGQPLGKFVYGKNYLASKQAVPIDPGELKLANTTYETQGQKGLFGALRDASPDFWGRRVIERHTRSTALSELDYLLRSPNDRAGALGFGLNAQPPAPLREYNRTMDLEKLQQIADAIIADEELPKDDADTQQAHELLGGTSMGGARPKAVVEDNEGLWIAKFNRKDDKWDYAKIERAMLELARECGIQAAISKRTTIGDRDALLVKRFDREKTDQGYRRARMLSALTLLRADENERDKWSYVVLAEEVRKLSSQPTEDGPELFKRMVFNALISNDDDHPRNHAMIALNEDWKLSPAYDLTPSTPVSATHRDLALQCGDMGRFANAKNLLTQCRRFLVEPEQAEKLIVGMEATVKARWRPIARAEGVTDQDCERISGAFAYEGFRQ